MNHPWVILLAAGDGTRVRDLARDDVGLPAPKQFCRLGGDRTLFRSALDRARTVTGSARVVPVVQPSHKRWWEREVAELPRENVLEGRVDHGTAVAVLRALRFILARDPLAVVVVMPADHGADDERLFCDAIRGVVEAAQEWPDHLILLGAEAGHEFGDYGWIVPAAGRGSRTAAVTRFHEKPPRGEAMRLANDGALINTFIAAATGEALTRLYARTLPELVLALASSADASRLAAAELPGRDFSRHLLERATQHLRVLRAAPCGWSDLGTPDRLRAWLARYEPVS